MSNNHFNYGIAVARRWLETGCGDDLNSIITDMHSDVPDRRSAGGHAVCGAFIQIADSLRAVQEAGIRFSVAIPTVERLLYAQACSEDDFWRTGQLLIDAASALRQQLPGVSISWSKHRAPEPAELPAKAEPLKVEIISMPDRRTETEVQRDKKNSITHTSQIERDAA